jgi:glycine/D-amino acid oxidase-like deaminating enzyme
VRALPPRRHAGKLPLLGRLHNTPNAWLIGGLGARGLVYHAFLAKMLVSAIVADDESMLLDELTAWQRSKPK